MSAFVPAMHYNLLFACYSKACFHHAYRNESNIKANSNSKYGFKEHSPFIDAWSLETYLYGWLQPNKDKNKQENIFA